MSKQSMNGKRILVFGAHPDDIEFGCGAYLCGAKEDGADISLVVLSRGEAGTYGDPKTREDESRKAASLLEATICFPETAGDTRIYAEGNLSLLAAKLIRQYRPDIVLVPSGHLNQHPDHRETSLLVRDANRLARYGKTPGLEDELPHASSLLLFYDISSESPGSDGQYPVIVDISHCVDAWKQLMKCHQSQIQNMDYVDLQLSRARALGIQMGVHSALRFYSEGPLLVSRLDRLKSARL